VTNTHLGILIAILVMTVCILIFELVQLFA
jgi:hypothetical protein